MVHLNIKNAIIHESKEIGIDAIGFALCGDFNNIEPVLADRVKKEFLSGFETWDIKKGIDPSLLLDGCRTMISAALSYNIDKSLIKQKSEYGFKANMSRSSWGMDYHKVMKDKLGGLAAYIEKKFDAKAKIFVDSNPLLEREIARRAGIGFTGKNCSIISPIFGSYIFLGEILTDLKIDPDDPVDDSCGNCDLCIKACPSGALCEEYTLNAKKCVSYLTQIKDIPEEYYGNMKYNIYGCDACQDVCPRNKNAPAVNHPEFIPKEWNAYPDALRILNMDNKTFKETFKGTSCGWRGKKNIQKNALIAISNSKNKSNAKYLLKMLSDERNDIRKVCIYAIYNLLNDGSKDILEEHLKTERDVEIREIIKKLIGLTGQ
ncbi:MAG TPA: tRNA epoxyqueuosine(34) reductase QueG [Clostridiaceae bacterium]|nr:tRNA epoxyqueuosine(34) reductase QueG [Clostridiaceae bacterium]